MTPQEFDFSVTRNTEYATALAIETGAAFDEAYRALHSIKALAALIVQTFAKPKEAAYRSHKEILAAEAKYLGPLQEAEKIIKAKIGGYLTAQKEAARKEQEALQAKAEQERKEEILKLQLAGKKTAAAALKKEPVVAELANVENTGNLPGGMQARKVFKFTITDAALLPREYLMADEVKIRKVVNALGLECRIPGVEVIAENQIAVRL